MQQEAQRHVEPQREQEPEEWPRWKRLRDDKDEDGEESSRLPPNVSRAPVAISACRASPSSADEEDDIESSPRSPLRNQDAVASLRSAEEEIRDISD